MSGAGTGGGVQTRLGEGMWMVAVLHDRKREIKVENIARGWYL